MITAYRVNMIPFILNVIRAIVYGVLLGALACGLYKALVVA